jgi:hypothetical protein
MESGDQVADVFIMGYFTESPNGLANAFSLHLAYSFDGLN